MAWRNHVDSRRFFRETRIVSPAEHRTWLEWVLTDPSSDLWIGEANGVPVGQIRVTHNESAAELHITVAPYLRGLGIGRVMIQSIAAREPGLLVAYVKTGNVASERAFEAAGFSYAGERHGYLRFERSI